MKWTLVFLSFFINNYFVISYCLVIDNNLKYNQVTFLTSHNSYAAKRSGYWYAQQNLTIKEQLNFGVRGLMLDTYRSCSIFNGDRIILSHGNSIVNRLLMIGKKPITFLDSLKEIKKFLEKNKTEIITIFLENYVLDQKLVDQDIERSGLSDLVLKPSDWNPDFNMGSWPAIKWMQQANKRVVIFNSIEKSKYSYFEWKHVIENQYGTLCFDKALNQRKESKVHSCSNRSLLLLNYIPTFKLNISGAYNRINSSFLFNLISRCYKNGLDRSGYCKGKIPNFINIDFIDEGSGLYFVNLLNSFS